MLNQIDLSRADLNLLVLFETVMRERHVGRAARSLNLSPSAVSHGLSRLRALMGDPLFIKTPRGVTPTDRALALETPVADILAGIRAVLATSAPFDARTSSRTFTIGAPDGTAAVFLPTLVKHLREHAPHVGVRVRQLMPRAGETSIEAGWRDAFAALDARAMDVAVMPIGAGPARFEIRPLFEEDFVVAARAGHAWLKKPTLSAFAAAEHLVVSQAGDPFGFVDIALAERGLTRRVALTAPNFLLALALLAGSNLIAAVPRSLFALHGARFRLGSAKPPLPLPRFAMNAFAPKPALQDAGLRWLVETLAESSTALRRRRGTT
ncbi:MAG TPA: LysR family transcriptional regulator [Candidatus Binatia bacterium]|nr:LysR family transcriptional regulator [Candidatus Binatia bacterium]